MLQLAARLSTGQSFPESITILPPYNVIYQSTEENQRDEIRHKYQQSDNSEKIFIPAKPKTNPFEKTGTQRVCAYCRVSTDNIEQLTSFELQQAYYRDVAEHHPNWDLKHIYADEGISATSLKNRDEFNQMIADCESGLYDLIVTKSVSRFARNLVDCISLVRRLKSLNPPVGVFFETDNLYTLAENSELMLSLLASFAQEESLKKSESMNWSLMQRLKTGKLLTPALLGYDRDNDGHLVINESEAMTVKFIFGAFLAGFTTRQIADILTDIGRPTKTGETAWHEGSINYILKNERYCGNVLTWKTFTCDIFEHKKRRNRQDRDQYLYKDAHEAIISDKEYEATQMLFQERRHHMRGGVPILHVIDEGVFRGYVPINHHWVNYDSESYYNASSYAGNESGLPQRIKKSTFSMFDLKGYQIVRGQFLSAVAHGPAISISNRGISFNAGCVRKFSSVSNIQILLHPAERKLAIRPCGENDVYNVNWRTDPDGPLYPKSYICRHFSAALFDIMEWNPDFSYRIRGVWASRRDDEIIIFDLSEAVAAILYSVETEAAPVKKRVITFPEEWESDFGLEFYDYGVNSQFRFLHSNVDWKADSKPKPIPDTIQFRAPSNMDVQGMIDDLRTS